MTNLCPNCFAGNFSGDCGQCGYKALSDQVPSTMLPPGIVLNGRYRLGRVLGAGGFGVTYLALDQERQSRVAIKEYMPVSFAVRLADGQRVTASSTDSKETFDHGLLVFNREINTLKSFRGNQTIVQALDSFQANGTAYFVMEFLDGITLSGLAKANGGKLNPKTAMEILSHTAVALKVVHGGGMLHRDVSPDNILITRKGQVKLIDFGATRYFVGERSQSLSVVLKAGFAPPEQYSSKGNQGPWTDIYAMCATFYTVVTGKRPPDAPERLQDATLEDLTRYQLQPNLAQAITKGLSLDLRQRQQNMSEFLAEFQPELMANPPQPQLTPLQQTPQPQQRPQKKTNSVQRVNTPSPAPPPLPKPQVVVHGTPYVRLVGSSSNQDRWMLPKNVPMRIGRSAQHCNIIIDHNNISRIHCELRYDEKRSLFYLTELSSNGTFMDGLGRLTKGKIYTLKPGGTFYILGKACTMEVGLC